MSNYKAEYNVHLISGISNDASTPIARAKDIEVDKQKNETTNYTLDEVLTDLQNQIDNASGGGSGGVHVFRYEEEFQITDGSVILTAALLHPSDNCQVGDVIIDTVGTIFFIEELVGGNHTEQTVSGYAYTSGPVLFDFSAYDAPIDGEFSVLNTEDLYVGRTVYCPLSDITSITGTPVTSLAVGTIVATKHEDTNGILGVVTRLSSTEFDGTQQQVADIKILSNNFNGESNTRGSAATGHLATAGGKGYYIYGMLPNPASFVEWKQNTPDEPIYQPTAEDQTTWNSLCENVENAGTVQGALLLTANEVETIDYPSDGNGFDVILTNYKVHGVVTSRPEWATDDLLSVVNGVHYDNCAKVVDIIELQDAGGRSIYAVLYTDKTRTFDKTVGSTGGPGVGKDTDSRHAYSVRVPAKPNAGDVELMQFATAIGESVIASGENSFATGYQTIAGGAYSTAEGAKTYAAYSAHAEGQSTTAGREQAHAEGLLTKALGVASHAEGSETSAKGDFSHAENFATKSQGKYSHAEGSITTASGTAAHSEGDHTTADGNYSHAEGLGTSTALGASAAHAEGQNTRANAPLAHAEGEGSKAEGRAAHAEGNNTTAKGAYSHAEGQSTIANGQAAHAQGSGTAAQGNYSSASGLGTSAIGEASSARGKYARSSADYLEVVGNGVSANQRRNAYSVDYEGNFNISGDVLDENGTPVAGSNIIGVQANGPLSNRTSIDAQEAGVLPARVHKGDMIRDIATGDTAIVTTLTLDKKLYTGSALSNIVGSSTSGSWGQIFTLHAGETVTSLTVKFGGDSAGKGLLQFYEVPSEDSTEGKIALTSAIEFNFELNTPVTARGFTVAAANTDRHVYWEIRLTEGAVAAPYGAGFRPGVKCVQDGTVFTEGKGWTGAYAIGATVGIEGATSARGDDVAVLNYAEVVTNGSGQRGCAIFTTWADGPDTINITDLLNTGTPTTTDVILALRTGNIFRINTVHLDADTPYCAVTLITPGITTLSTLEAGPSETTT